MASSLLLDVAGGTAAYGSKVDLWIKKTSGNTNQLWEFVTLTVPSVANCGGDENGRLEGGVAGDQTGREYTVKQWSNWGQVSVFRHPDANVRAKLAELSRKAAMNDHIGYDQNERLTFYQALQAAGWNPEAIKTNVETDCSASTGAIIVATGNLLGISQLAYYPHETETARMTSALIAAGFQQLTDSKYLESGYYLLEGDICLKPGYHANVLVTSGMQAW